MLYKTYCSQIAISGYKESLLYHGVAFSRLVHICADEGKVQDGAEDWYSSDEAHYNWEETPKQEEKAVDLQHHSDDGPADQNHQHTTQEEAGGLHFMFLEEETEGPLQPDDKGKSSNKQDISNSQECFVKKQDHPEEEEKNAEAC